MAGFTQIFVKAEEIAAGIVKKYPTLTKIAKHSTPPVGGAAAGAAVGWYLRGPSADLKKAKEHLDSCGHDHDAT